MPRSKTFTNGGKLYPADLNQIQDDLSAAIAAVQVASQPLDADLTLYAAAASPGAQLGLNDGTTVRRGHSIVASAESRSSASYGFLTTPDRVQNLVLPTNGVIRVLYCAQWVEALNNIGRAAIFLKTGGVDTQQKIFAQPVAATVNWAGGSWCPLSSCPTGLIGSQVAVADPVTTGEALGIVTNGNSLTQEINGSVVQYSGIYPGPVGGFCEIDAVAGTYDVSVQFKSDGTHNVTARNRRLYVEAIGF